MKFHGDIRRGKVTKGMSETTLPQHKKRLTKLAAGREEKWKRGDSLINF